jgi:hypothetical protein
MFLQSCFLTSLCLWKVSRKLGFFNSVFFPVQFVSFLPEFFPLKREGKGLEWLEW